MNDPKSEGEIQGLLKKIGELSLKLCYHDDKDTKELGIEINHLARCCYDKTKKVNR